MLTHSLMYMQATFFNAIQHMYYMQIYEQYCFIHDWDMFTYLFSYVVLLITM